MGIQTDAQTGRMLQKPQGVGFVITEHQYIRVFLLMQASC